MVVDISLEAWSDSDQPGYIFNEHSGYEHLEGIHKDGNWTEKSHTYLVNYLSLEWFK